MTKFRIMAVACALALLGACSKKEEKQGLPPAQNWQAPETGQSPVNPHAGMPGMGDPHAGMGGDPHAGMGGDPHAGMGGNPHAGMGDPHGGAGGAGQVDVTAMGLTPPDPDRAIDPEKYLKGTIRPTAETKDHIPSGAVIFLSVKRADPSTGAGVGAPLAVKRLRLTTWPVWFQLTEEDAMVSGTAFDGDVVITGWADQDGDAISKLPGDVIGEVKASIPAKDLVLTLDTILR